MFVNLICLVNFFEKVFIMSFEKNLQEIRSDFASAMEMDAGKNVKVKDIFKALEDLYSGKYNSITEMYTMNNFNSQNVVFKAISAVLTEKGTPVKELRSKNRKSKLEGTSFALNLIKQKGLSVKV